jgi:thioredoxin 1
MFKIVITLSASTLLLLGCSKKEIVNEPSKESVKIVTSQDTTTTLKTTTDKITHISSTEQFNTIISEPGKLSVVDMYADWCRPCQMLVPIFNDLSDKYGASVNFLKVNVDNNREIAQKYEVRSIPYVVLIKDGEIIEAITGLNQPEKYEESLLKYK